MQNGISGARTADAVVADPLAAVLEAEVLELCLSQLLHVVQGVFLLTHNVDVCLAADIVDKLHNLDFDWLLDQPHLGEYFPDNCIIHQLKGVYIFEYWFGQLNLVVTQSSNGEDVLDAVL